MALLNHFLTNRRGTEFAEVKKERFSSCFDITSFLEGSLLFPIALLGSSQQSLQQPLSNN